MSNGLHRRALVVAATAVTAGLAAGAVVASNGGEAQRAAGPREWRFFDAQEAAAVDAIVDRLIPADGNGPGGRDAGVPEFIDRQLAGPWGAGLQFYAAGPFASGTPRQGYQLPHTPAALVREGLARLRPVAEARLGGRRLEEARPEELDALLRSLERGETDLSPIPSAVFFRQLLDLAMEGFFSDPVYGGNRDMAGWKLVGFPGAHATYAQEIERHGMAWRRPPVSMADPDALCDPPGGGANGGRRT